LPSRPPERRRPNQATVVSWLALFVALGGVASGLPGRETVNSGDVVNDSLRSKDVRNRTIRAIDLGRHQVRGGNIEDHVIGRHQLVLGGVGTASLADAAVTPAKLASVPAVKVTTPQESPGCTTQTIASNATETVQWSEEVYDTAAMHSPPPSGCGAGQQSRLTAPIPGIYLVTVGIAWTSSVGGVRDVAIVRNGSDRLAADLRSATASGDSSQVVSTVADLSEGGYIEIEVGQDSGSPVSLLDLDQTNASLVWLAPQP